MFIKLILLYNKNRIGGLFGYISGNTNTNGKLEYVYNIGNINAFNAVSFGGIVGWIDYCNLNITISFCAYFVRFVTWLF